MIRIRYRGSNELSPGLHAAAEQHGRTTTVYLLSGLTAAERRSALRRLRLTARMGHCPRLPAAQLAFALFIGPDQDRHRPGGRRPAAAPGGQHRARSWCFPAGRSRSCSSPPSRSTSCTPRTADQSDAGTPVASASAIAIGGRIAGPDGRPGRPRDAGQSRRPGDRGPRAAWADRRPAADPAERRPGGPRSPGRWRRGATGAAAASAAGRQPVRGSGQRFRRARQRHRAAAGRRSAGARTSSPVTPRADHGRDLRPRPPRRPARRAAPADGPAAAELGSSSGTPSGVCVNVGPLGVCLNI